MASRKIRSVKRNKPRNESDDGIKNHFKKAIISTVKNLNLIRNEKYKNMKSSRHKIQNKFTEWV